MKILEPQKNIILKIKAGSHLYGTNTENSDTDYLGIYLAPSDEVLGLYPSDEFSENVESKLVNGKNSKYAVDCKYYELRKFCRLALKCNPTMLEMLFVNEDNIVEINSTGRTLLRLKHHFLSKHIYSSFMGYAVSQKKKCFEKKENIQALLKLQAAIVPLPAKEIISEHIEYLQSYGGMKIVRYEDGKWHYTCGGMNFNNIRIKDLKSIVDQRIEQSSHRTDGLLKHGLDYKFMSHNIRLMLEGMELIRTKNLQFPLQYTQLIKDIKLGKIENGKIIELMEKYEDELHSLKHNDLPETGNTRVINEFCIYEYEKNIVNTAEIEPLKIFM